MTEPKFTPGPWRKTTEKEDDDFMDRFFCMEGIQVTNGKTLIAEAQKLNTDLTETEFQANANLIAAAPEIYRLLDALLVYVIAEADEPNSIDWRRVYVDLGIEIKAALATARGKG